MMQLERTTRAERDAGRKALVPFFTAGYPGEGAFLDLVRAAADAGCRTVEVGIPFSDPVADGPLIQASSLAALRAGMTLRRALALTARATAATGVGAVVMSYANPVLRFGATEFAAAARDAGVVGVILPDVPHEEAAPLRGPLAAAGLPLIELIAPTTGAERVARIAADARGFLYLVALTGVTGAVADPAAHAAQLVGRARAVTDLPCYVGFGVSDAEGARRVVRDADGVIVGSALVRLLQSAPHQTAGVGDVAEFLQSLRKALASPAREVRT
ncbi:MAG: tryptophan synthase subunit alpha [Candidatus Latescibacteria bacterium]|nr:tryptophan synthase subunit alpha [Candidatus Latescibacterota bacterium]